MDDYILINILGALIMIIISFKYSRIIKRVNYPSPEIEITMMIGEPINKEK